eukprot:365636-Chlamydomonas_euryale.AAC.3
MDTAWGVPAGKPAQGQILVFSPQASPPPRLASDASQGHSAAPPCTATTAGCAAQPSRRATQPPRHAAPQCSSAVTQACAPGLSMPGPCRWHAWLRISEQEGVRGGVIWVRSRRAARLSECAGRYVVRKLHDTARGLFGRERPRDAKARRVWEICTQSMLRNSRADHRAPRRLSRQRPPALSSCSLSLPPPTRNNGRRSYQLHGTASRTREGRRSCRSPARSPGRIAIGISTMLLR